MYRAVRVELYTKQNLTIKISQNTIDCKWLEMWLEWGNKEFRKSSIEESCEQCLGSDVHVVYEEDRSHTKITRIKTL